MVVSPARLWRGHGGAVGERPHLASYPRVQRGRHLLAPASPAQVSRSEAAAEPADRYRDILARILNGLLCS